jgi:hypothetical protein
MDKDLKADRNGRWQKAFSEDMDNEEDPRVTTNRQATIVIEHLMQASDVSHTMQVRKPFAMMTSTRAEKNRVTKRFKIHFSQHWHIFRKWNERLFREMYSAYQEGRAEKNPAEFWYEG